MTFIWLVVWLIARTPSVEALGPWNNWGTALVVCIAIDVIGALGRSAHARTRTGG